MKQKRQRYTPPTRYTLEELDRAAIEDLCVDVACALRDGQPDYAATQRRALAARIAAYRAAYGTEPTIAPWAKEHIA